MSFLDLFKFNSEHVVQLPGKKPETKENKENKPVKTDKLNENQVFLNDGRLALRSTEIEDGAVKYTLTIGEDVPQMLHLTDREKSEMDRYNETKYRVLSEKKAMMLKPLFLKGKSYNEASEIMIKRGYKTGFSPSTCAGYWSLFNACK